MTDEQLIAERDYAEQMADKLSDAIARHFKTDIGEHSNKNNPWTNALEIISSADSLEDSE